MVYKKDKNKPFHGTFFCPFYTSHTKYRFLPELYVRTYNVGCMLRNFSTFQNIIDGFIY